MKYSANIIGWGEDALGFLEDEEMNFIIIFNENAPEELREIAILHEISTLHSEVEVGDTFIICDKVFDVTAVGYEAQHTLKELGHCTLSFKGGSVPERPGCIMLEGEPLKAADIRVGGKIQIF